MWNVLLSTGGPRKYHLFQGEMGTGEPLANRRGARDKRRSSACGCPDGNDAHFLWRRVVSTHWMLRMFHCRYGWPLQPSIGQNMVSTFLATRRGAWEEQTLVAFAYEYHYVCTARMPVYDGCPLGTRIGTKLTTVENKFTSYQNPRKSSPARYRRTITE